MVAVLFILSVSVHPAMAAQAINEEINCPTCSGGIDDISSIPGLENTTIPTISVREISRDPGKVSLTAAGAGKAQTVSGTHTQHLGSTVTIDIQDPRRGQKVVSPTRPNGNPEITDPALAGFIANASSEGYDFTGKSSHRYESTLQSDDLLSLNSSQKLALGAGGFAFTAEDTVLSYRDTDYYTFTNRTTQTQRYLMEVQQLDASGNPVGEREYTLSPEFNPDGSLAKVNGVQATGYNAQSSSPSGKTCFWQWVAVVTLGACLLLIVLSPIPALGIPTMLVNLLSIIFSSDWTYDHIIGRYIIIPEDYGNAYFSAAGLASLALVGLGFLILLAYAVYKLGVCMGWWDSGIWKNHEWDHEGGDFGLTDNGKTKELYLHDRFMVTLFANTSGDKDARWNVVSHPGLDIKTTTSPKTKGGRIQAWIIEATELGSHELILEYQTTKPVPASMEITRYTLPLSVVKIPWGITTVDNTSKKAGVGKYNSLVIDKSSIPHISYYDAVNDRIMYATVINGAWTKEAVADTAGTFTTSLALDPAGNPAISYGNGLHAGDMMFAHRNKSAWIVERVEKPGNVGQFSSLVIDSAGTPHITYNDGRHYANLNYATKNGSAWKISTIDNGGALGNTGYGSSLVVNSSGQMFVAYTKGEKYGTLMFAQANVSGNWKTTKVDNGGGKYKKTGYDPSIALDSAGNPHISYYDESHQDLKYASWNGTAWNRETVHATGKIGKQSSLAINTRDQPFISYYDTSNKELRFATRNPGEQVWVSHTVDNNGVGEYSSLALDPSGHPNIAYYDAENHALKYAGWIP
jgi:hypothetical protein